MSNFETLTSELVFGAKVDIACWLNKTNPCKNNKTYMPSDCDDLWNTLLNSVQRMPLPAEISFTRDRGGDHSDIPSLPHVFYTKATEISELMRKEYIVLVSHKLKEYGISTPLAERIAEQILGGRRGSSIHIFV